MHKAARELSRFELYSGLRLCDIISELCLGSFHFTTVLAISLLAHKNLNTKVPDSPGLVGGPFLVEREAESL